MANSVHGSIALLRTMLDAGGNPNAVDEQRRPIMFGIWQLGYFEDHQRARLELLLERGADINSALPDDESVQGGYTLLLYRAGLGRSDATAYADALLLLERGADSDCAAKDGMTLAQLMQEHRAFFSPEVGGPPPEFERLGNGSSPAACCPRELLHSRNRRAAQRVVSLSMTPAVLWHATRAYSLPASVVPVALGTVLAARGYGGVGEGRFDLPDFVLVLLGAILAHFGANVINDYFDFVNGVDTRPEHGSGVLTGGEMTAPHALIFAVALFAGAGLCGLLLVRSHAAVVVPLAAVGLGCAVLYSAFLKRYGVGDLLIIIAFGFGLTLGAYGVQIGELSTGAALLVCVYAIPVCLLVDAILHANNLRDAPDDRAARVRTLATMLSPRAGQMLQLFLLFGPLAFIVIGVLTRFLPLWSLGTLLAVPLLVRAARTGSVEGTAQTHLAFRLLYTVSLLLKPVFL